ncbi:PAS domain S-box-containing protein [Marivirga sericea]|uniref:histidine kinase n=1 Tax=Marivirga sericea TaxID=1028 RepID=A0A1X7KDQ3_9BACT|nr:PAS domain-containing sensor histidine kinase [Marivirga sericea]SMG39053.1 PAS domain S-box-containing protein [Marivirga sericea]
MPHNNQIHLQDFMDLSLDIVCVISTDGKFINVSQASKRIWGYDREELIGNYFINYVAKADRIETKEVEEQIKNGREVTHFENNYIHKDGSLIPIIWSAKFEPKKGLIFCIAKDNSPIKKRDIEKEEIIQSSHDIINGTQNLIWCIDKKYQLLDFNKAMKTQFQDKFNVQLEVGQNMVDFPPDHQEYINRWKSLYDQCLAGETISVEIAPSEHKNVEPSWVHANLTPIYEGDAVKGLVCHSTDITEKKKIELELQKQNDLVQNILKHIPMGVAVNKISTGNQILINQEFSNTYGWPESELTDVNSFFKKVYPDPIYRKEISEMIIEGIESGDINKMRWNEIKITTKKGQSKYVDAKNIPLTNQDLMISTVMDVTQKVNNKKKIANALEEKQNILESISDAFYALDKNLNFTYVNESALKSMNKSQNDLIGKNLFEEFPQLGNTVFKEFLKEVKRTGKPSQFEFYYKYYDLWFDESIYPSRDGYSIYYKDITKRKLITEALEEAYEKESQILESISDAFVAVDRNFNFTYFNKKAEQLLNITREEALGKNQWDLFEYAKGSIAEQEYNKSIQNNETRTFDFYNERLNIWLNISSYPSKNGLSIYFRDITQEKKQRKELERLNAELKSYTQKLEQSNKDLEQFAYIASHDLQEPLRMVSSFMTQLQKKYEDQLDEKGQTYINFAVDGTRRIRQIIIDLLEFSRAGTQNQKLEKLDLNEELAEVLSLHHTNLNKYNINLEVEDLPELVYTKTGIRQLFHNLIGNAIKYRRKEGQANIAVTWKDHDEEFLFEITDNGIGIDEKYENKIFQIFQRLHSKSEYSGTGIGLAICKKIVEKYGGEIWLNSKLGIGSTFCFTIPKNIKP